MKTTPRLPIDDLRRFATDLASAAGLAPFRAASLAGFALWFEEIGRPEFGLATLPNWLDRLDRGEFAANLTGEIARPEPAASAILDGHRVLPPLLLDRAAGIAAEKAREVGVGLVRVIHLAHPGPLAAIAATLAVGPSAGLVLGPGNAVAIGVPTAGSPPIVYDSALAGGTETDLLAGLATPWRALLSEGESLVLAASTTALFPDHSFRDRIDAILASSNEHPGLLLPDSVEERRRQVRESGIALAKGTRDRLKASAERLGVSVPWVRKSINPSGRRRPPSRGGMEAGVEAADPREGASGGAVDAPG